MLLFCIAIVGEIVTRTWGIYLVDGKPIKGSKHFWVDLDGKHVFAPTPSVGVVDMWWCVCDLDFKSMTSLS